MMQTDERHYALFKAECERWIDAFGLKDWDVHYRHEDCDLPLTGAWSMSDASGRVVTIGLSKEYGNREVEDAFIRRSALHEVLHVLLAEFQALIDERAVTRNMTERAAHAVIRRLESVLLK